MRFVSKLALAAVLSMGATVLGAAPAAAQKADKKADKDAGLKVSDEFRKPAAAAETAVNAKDWATAEPSIAAAEAAAKNDDERYYAAWLRFRMDASRNNEEGQLKALPILVASPRTPATDMPIYQGQYNFLLGQQAASQKKFAEAIPLLLKAREAGSKQPDIEILLANAYSATGKPAESVAEVNRAIEANKATGKKAPEAWYRFAIPRVYQTGDRAATAQWLSRLLADYPSVQNWRWGILIFREGANSSGARFSNAQKIDLYRLMRATKALADLNDYLEYSNLVTQAGLPWEAVAVVGDGRASGKAPAGNADLDRMYAAAQTRVKAEGSLDTLAKQAATAKDGSTASQTADAYLASANYAKALELYDLAVQKGGVNADEVNLHRGQALYYLGRKDEARTAFGLVKAPGSADVALLWTTALDLPPLA
ncbi:tetratricopeptide repeat protein [Sphingomonas sp. dw_22]|uniref:tetratricopeptide repeat protein n=1 Tax=Sphingomonas sp. dw_22 TaxID=2721175 RepID=UPI001BD3DAAF|nr:tetratricopeptide repeat protein [Sphingomonas sp. dw_22]